ncbi:MAG: serine hydrolase domain-containing protein [Longimicrobiales bacterium]
MLTIFTSPDGRQRVRLLTTSFLAAAALTAACADRSPLYDVPSQVAEPPAPRFTKAVDSARGAVRRRIREGNLPGVSVAVARNGAVVWAEAFGWSDVSSGVVATPRTLYPVGSISKSLTATAAGLLHERGRLNFDVPIQTYLPQFPQKRWPITTGQLMGHISGVVRDGGMAEILRQPHCDDARAAIAAVADDTLEFEPGTEWRYSNFGWRLVGAVVEAAAGEPFLAFMDREVFNKAGMEQTVPDLGDEGPNESVKYDRASMGTLRRGQDIDMSCSMAPGGFLSTPTELVRFGYAMQTGKLLDSATVKLFWKPQQLKSGAPTTYGYGWGIQNVALGDDKAATTKMIGHGGAVLGGRASLMIFPDLDMVVAVMTNANGDVSGFAREVAGIFRDPK